VELASLANQAKSWREEGSIGKIILNNDLEGLKLYAKEVVTYFPSIESFPGKPFLGLFRGIVEWKTTIQERGIGRNASSYVFLANEEGPHIFSNGC
jgi:hypothetical protein